MFVEATDFDGYPYNLPNLDRIPNTFTDFVDYLEEEALVNLLGRSFYDLMIAGLAEATPDQKWLDVRDGADYTYNGVGYAFGGLKKLLTPYVYAEFVREDFEKYSGVGALKPKAENADVISPRRMITKGWNKYVEMLGFSYDEDCEMLGHYYDHHHTFSVSNNNTLYGLLESNELYPDYEYNNPGTINIFDL